MFQFRIGHASAAPKIILLFLSGLAGLAIQIAATCVLAWLGLLVAVLLSGSVLTPAEIRLYSDGPSQLGLAVIGVGMYGFGRTVRKNSWSKIACGTLSTRP